MTYRTTLSTACSNPTTICRTTTLTSTPASQKLNKPTKTTGLNQSQPAACTATATWDQEETAEKAPPPAVQAEHKAWQAPSTPQA